MSVHRNRSNKGAMRAVRLAQSAGQDLILARICQFCLSHVSAKQHFSSATHHFMPNAFLLSNICFWRSARSSPAKVLRVSS